MGWVCHASLRITFFLLFKAIFEQLILMLAVRGGWGEAQEEARPSRAQAGDWLLFLCCVPTSGSQCSAPVVAPGVRKAVRSRVAESSPQLPRQES